MDSNGFITLTDAGRQIAETIYERHTLLSKWLTKLGVESPDCSRRCLPHRTCQSAKKVLKQSKSTLRIQSLSNKRNVHEKFKTCRSALFSASATFIVRGDSFSLPSQTILAAVPGSGFPWVYHFCPRTVLWLHNSPACISKTVSLTSEIFQN